MGCIHRCFERKCVLFCAPLCIGTTLLVSKLPRPCRTDQRLKLRRSVETTVILAGGLELRKGPLLLTARIYIQQCRAQVLPISVSPNTAQSQINPEDHYPINTLFPEIPSPCTLSPLSCSVSPLSTSPSHPPHYRQNPLTTCVPTLPSPNKPPSTYLTLPAETSLHRAPPRLKYHHATTLRRHPRRDLRPRGRFPRGH